MIVADYIFSEVAKYVDTVFFLPGGGSMYLVDALGRSGIKPVTALHEQGAGLMAVGYAMLHGLGVCLVTSGPGSTNAITACAAAWMDSIPVLFISGQARSNTLIGHTKLRTRGMQEVDIVKLVAPITKGFCQIAYKRQIEWILPKLITDCMTGRRGPCWLSVPLDIQAEEL